MSSKPEFDWSRMDVASDNDVEEHLDRLAIRSARKPENRVPCEDYAAHDAKLAKDGNPKDSIGDTKVPLHLCSPIAEAEWALAHYAGLLKYGAWNWRITGVRWSVYEAAIKRHSAAMLAGEEFDPFDGTRHEANIMACCAIIMEARSLGVLIDDRPPRTDIRPTYSRVQTQMAILKKQYSDMVPKHYTILDTPPKKT